ncbi:MAG TPA: ABC transporter permease [Chryseolinea sp.]|nr:ABC transporter permease [Chryseolinea sp.]
MLRNYLLSVWRYIARNRSFTAINILGLVIGMTAFMLITQYVVHELSYDKFWANSDRIYRVQLDRYDKGELSTRWASGANGLGPDLKDNFPEVEAYARLTGCNSLLSHGDVYFKEDHIYFASQDFFKVFGVKLLEGTDSTALKGLNKIVLSRSLAKKYFRDESPLGKTMRNNGNTEFMVTGVYDDIPANSHMAIDAVLSFATFAKGAGRDNEEAMREWQWDGFYTYLLLDKKADANALEKKFNAYVLTHLEQKFKDFSASMVLHLQFVSDIHLDSSFIGEFKENGNRDTTYFLMVVAALTILIAWINYVNLSTAKSIERAREVGIRKVMGSFRSQLVQQFLAESLLLNSVAVAIAIAAVALLTPWFSGITDRPLDYILFRQPLFWTSMLALIFGGALLSGMYPAFVLSSYKPVEVLKGRFKNTHAGVAFRKGMVITQFVASLTLIIGTFTVYQQISFMRNQKLGIDVEQTLVMRTPNIVVDSLYGNSFRAFKRQLEQHAEVVAMTGSSSIPGSSPDWNAGGIRRLSQREDEQNQYRVIMMDADFIPIYGLEVIAGRPFSHEVKNEQKSLMLNESAVKTMGFDNPDQAIDDHVFFWGDTFRIVGVVKNYHQESVKKSFEPLLFRYSDAPWGLYSIRFNAADVRRSLAGFETDWKAVFPGNPFSYFFLDDHYNKQYKADQQFGEVFGIFSGLAILIACLGLFGLSSLTAIQRTKEIGVRKVLGASVPGILTLISKDYLILMAIAIACAAPLTWWIMSNWLEDFASRISLTWWIFAAPSLLVVVVALLTVSVHTWKAARTNPAKSLRYE